MDLVIPPNKTYNDDTKKQEFYAYKNTLRRLINQAKKNIILNNLTKTNVMAKKTWQTIDPALHRKTPKFSPDAIIIDYK